MPVQWSVENVNNYGEKFPDRIDDEGGHHWNDVTMSILWGMLALAQHSITEKNWEEIFRLLHLYEMLNGAFQRRYVETADGKHIEQNQYLTAQNVYDHIGFFCNGGAETFAQAKNRTVKNFFDHDCKDLIAQVVKENADVV